MSTTCTPHDLLGAREQLGLHDDTDVMQRVFDRFAKRTDVDTLVIDGLHWIDRTLVARKWVGKTLTGQGTLQQRTDTGGLSGTDVTSRALLRFEYGEGITVKRLRLLGPKREPGRNRKYEAQHGVHILGVRGVVINDVTISDVHGDGLNVASHHRDRSHTPTRHVSLMRCTVMLTGRAGVCANDFEDLNVWWCRFEDTASTVMLVEAGRRPKTNGPLYYCYNSIVGGGSYAVHLIGGGRSALEDVTIIGNRRSGSYAFCVAIDGPDKETAGKAWPIYRGIEIAGNRWTRPSAPGKTFRFRDCADVAMHSNEGPVDDPTLLAHNGQPDDGKPRPYVSNCVGFRSGPNALRLVER